MKKKTFTRIFFVAVAVFFWSNAFTQGKGALHVDKVLQVKFVNEPQVLKKVEAQFEQQGSQISLKSAGGAEFLTVKGLNQLNALSEKYTVKEMKRVFRPAGKFEEKHRAFGLHLWYEITYDGNADVEKVAQDFAGVEYIQASSPRCKAKLVGTLTTTPNDPYYSNQEWHYDLIELDSAWTIEAGNSNVVVAVEDEGIDVGHPDLDGNIWVNPGEIAGNNVDDDNNGYVDDIYGYNFIGDTGTIVPMNHGTHVAGTIAAETNNGIGLAGIAGGTGADDGVRVMSCQVFDSSSNGNFAEPFVYAADMGAVISQNSWGYANPGDYEQSTLEAIDYFVANAGGSGTALDGGLVTFAVGNDTATGLYYPGCYSSVMGVAATGPHDILASYSNYGSWVDISAPGGDSNIYVHSTIVDAYAGMEGTSMACPHVSGVAALVVSYNYGTLTNTELWDVLVNNTDDVSSLNPGYEGLMGSGRLNAYKALISCMGYESTASNETAEAALTRVSAIEENTLDKQVKIYPNPAMDVLNIAVSDFEASRYTILDVAGRIVKQGNLEESFTSVEISALSSGMYIVEVTNGSEKHSTKLMKR